MYSMTGYGKSVKIKEGKELIVEIKSVNHRFLDINTKLPKILIAVEDVLRKTIQDKVSRGRLDVFVTFQDKSEKEKNVFVDLGLARAYYSAAMKLQENFEVESDLTLTSIMKLPDVIKQEGTCEDREFLAELVIDCVSEAVDNLNAMRKVEGEKLKEDILTKISVMRELLDRIQLNAPKAADNYREKLTQRVTEVLGEIEIDQNKLINEVAFYVDKSSIDEEITRLKSHFLQGENILKKEVLIGRKMDFLIQEFNREANTICSKSNDIELTNTALSLKSEIEKVREQVQNLE